MSLREAVLKDRLKWLQHQVELTERELKKFAPATPQTLPGVPEAPPAARAKSKWQTYYDEFKATRGERLASLLGDQGLNVPLPADEDHHPAFVNAALAKIAGALRDGETLPDLFDLFFADAWPADKAPPYPFKLFCADGVWPKYLAQLRGEHRR